MIIFEMPPELQGSYKEQLEQLRQYLIRLALQLNEAERSGGR